MNGAQLSAFQANSGVAPPGTRGNNGARSTGEIARTDSATWVYGAFTQPDRDKVSTGPVASFTTASGIEGNVATSRSSGVEKKDKCDVNGKATTFAFKSADGGFASWSFVGAADVARHPEWRLVDCRHELSQPSLGAERYAQGHLPGAVHAHLLKKAEAQQG